MERIKDDALRKSNSVSSVFGDLGKEKSIIDWKLILRKKLQEKKLVWSQARSIKENNFAYRLINFNQNNKSETEVMIDVSGSISEEMVKSFLRQLKPILQSSKLKVGFFASNATREFQEVKTERDIDNLKIYHPGYSTDMDAAVRAFSKKPNTYKIVFTDGFPTTSPKDDLKYIDVIWLVYENRSFKPCCGTVIDVYPETISKLYVLDEQNDENS